MEQPAKDIAAIDSYHAHIYYDPAHNKEHAIWLRQEMETRFPPARMGRMHDVPVGPHPSAMFQVAFGTGLFERIVPWLMLNRRGLVVLVHPETGRPRDDHLLHALWMGERLPLNGSILPEQEEP
jgi:aromatic ring-cleaving dioxygenase